MFSNIGTGFVLRQLLKNIFDRFKFSIDQFIFISERGLSFQLKVKFKRSVLLDFFF